VRLFFAAVFGALLSADENDELWINRIEPLGAQRGTTVTAVISGEKLVAPTSGWFDTPGIEWIETVSASAKSITGKVRVGADVPLGPHLFHLKTAQGRTNTRLFHVSQFPAVNEFEPNDPPGKPQQIRLAPQVLHGYLKGRQDIDVYEFEARKGERWVFDLKSIEYGSHLECELALEDAQGRVVAFNDDRDDYLETPRIEHRFAADGTYRLKVDQFRGPQGVNCSENCGYMIEVSRLPVIVAADPLGLAPGAKTRIRLTGAAMEAATGVHLTNVRAGEMYRLTFPFTIPVSPGPDKVRRIEGVIAARGESWIDVDFSLPPDAPAGLHRLWIETAHGTADGLSLEVASGKELDEEPARRAPWAAGVLTINGRLTAPGEEDSYSIDAVAGRMIHARTLAVQLGLPQIDTVLELFDEHGKLLADHDDLMTGQGTVIGNPDSSLYYMPKQPGRLRLAVRDRTNRGGATYSYRLRLSNETPGFRLLTEPEEFRVRAGQESSLEVLLIPDPGFDKAVTVWTEGLPSGVTATGGEFPAGQPFGPSGDGDNVLIPAVHLKITTPATLPPGEYPFRVFGKMEGGQPVEAFTTLWIGPPRKRNDIRRPLPGISMTVTALSPLLP
jgi:hypothetical protein